MITQGSSSSKMTCGASCLYSIMIEPPSIQRTVRFHRQFIDLSRSIFKQITSQGIEPRYAPKSTRY